MGLAFFIITKNRQLQHAQPDKDTVRKGLNPLRVKIFITPVGKKKKPNLQKRCLRTGRSREIIEKGYNKC